MSDLISRSELIKHFEAIQQQENAVGLDFVAMIDEIKGQPTAYDVDEVVEEIKTRKEEAFNVLGRLAEYEDAEEQGLLLRLPCKVGSPLYRIYKKPTKCTAYGEYKDDYACLGCEKECDSSYVWDIRKYKTDIIKTINCLSDEIGKTVFLTQKEAEQKLKEMESESE